MSIQFQRHTLDTLTDGTEPGGMPLEPVSTWAVDLVGYEEPTGEWAELLDHCRDLAKGLLDPASGFMTYAEKQDERSDEDAMAIAVQAGERHYEQEQGFAPLTLEGDVISVPNDDAWQAARLLYDPEQHGRPRALGIRNLAYRLARDGAPVSFSRPLPDMTLAPALVIRPNGDAIIAAWLEEQSPSTSLTTPDLPNRRHWGDVDLGEQLEGVNPLDAEQRPADEPDALTWTISQLMREGGISPSFALDGVTVENLEEDLGEQGAANYLAHLVEMQEHLLRAQEREREHARRCRALHPLPPFRRIEWVEQQLEDGSKKRVAVGTPRSHPRYRDITQPWREQNLARKARFAARCDDGTRVPFDLYAHVVRGSLPVAASPRPPEPSPVYTLPYPEYHLLVFIERWLEANLPAPDHEKPAPAAPARRRPSPMELPSITDERWWGQHGHRILRLVADWHPTLEPGTDAWWDAAEDAYYVLKVRGLSTVARKLRAA